MTHFNDLQVAYVLESTIEKWSHLKTTEKKRCSFTTVNFYTEAGTQN
jgi:hypothetical protein